MFGFHLSATKKSSIQSKSSLQEALKNKDTISGIQLGSTLILPGGFQSCQPIFLMAKASNLLV